jgi:hypothetical protein
MESKICIWCKESKPLDSFGTNKVYKDGKQAKCKICLSKYEKKIRLTDEFRIRRRKTRNKLKENETSNKRYKVSKENQSDDYLKMLENSKIRSRKYREQIKQNNEKKEIISANKNRWEKEKMKNDIFYNTYRNFRSNFSKRYINKLGKKTFDVLDYTFEDFVNQIGLKKKNFHLDHKIPVTWFKEFIPNQVYDLRNLHWIPDKENLQKANSWAHPVDIVYFNLIERNIKEEYLNRFTKIYDVVLFC